MWDLHDRFDGDVNESTCRTEIESFRAHGQLVPVLGRSIAGDSDFDIELIYGARRLFVARHLNMKLAVEVRVVSDRKAIVLMEIENRQRQDVSPYERGTSFQRWLEGGHFESQDDLASNLKISASRVSRLLKLARLSPSVVKAFQGPLDMCESWGHQLVDALDDPSWAPAMIEKAQLMAALSTKLSAQDVFEGLMSTKASVSKTPDSTREEVVSDESGEMLFRITYQGDCVSMVLPRHAYAAATLGEIREAVIRGFQNTKLQATGFVDQNSDKRPPTAATMRKTGSSPAAGIQQCPALDETKHPSARERFKTRPAGKVDIAEPSSR
jgi:ParB/RepB/Spo0J family partition protein